MAHGSYEGRGVDAPEIRGLFTREAMLASDWYRERLRVKQERDIALWTRHVAIAGSVGRESLEEARAAIGASERAGVLARAGRHHRSRSVSPSDLIPIGQT